MNDLNYNILKKRFDLYNPEDKIEYALGFDGEDGTVITILYAFELASNLEFDLDKDLSVFTQSEVKYLFHSMGASSYSSVVKYITIFKSYVDWTISEGRRGVYENGINNIQLFQKMEDASKYTSVRKTLKKHPLEKEFEFALDIIYNPLDKFLVILPYYFIVGEKLTEIRNLKVTDIDFERKQVLIPGKDERVIDVDDRFLKLAREAIDEDIYIGNNGIEGKSHGVTERPLIESKYIVRPTKTNRSGKDEIMNINTLKGRYVKISNYTGEYSFTPLSIRNTRVVHEVMRQQEELGRKLNDNEIIDVFNKCEDMFKVNITTNQRFSIKKICEKINEVNV